MTPGELIREARCRHGLAQRPRIERDLVSPGVATVAELLDLMGEELGLTATPIDTGTTRR